MTIHQWATIKVVDNNEVFGLEVRQGVAQFHNAKPVNSDLELRLTSTVLAKVVSGQISFVDAVDSGAIKVDGNSAKARKFATYFEIVSPKAITLSIPVNHVELAK